MKDEIQSFVQDYSQWVKDRTSIRELEGSVEITTPYQDRHNDFLQIYVEKKEGGYLLTDDAYILNDLLDSGLDINTKKRRDLLEHILNGFGVKMKEYEITATAHAGNFVQKKHGLLQAMLAVNDMFYLAQPMVNTIFFEDVQTWLRQSDIRFVPNYKVTGDNGLDHRFDFSIPASKINPLRVVETINRLNKEKTESLSFAWVNSRNALPQDSLAYAIVNDSDHPPVPAFIEALEKYNIQSILWSQRDRAIDLLAA